MNNLQKIVIPILSYTIFIKCQEMNSTSAAKKQPKTQQTVSNFTSLVESAVNAYSLTT